MKYKLLIRRIAIWGASAVCVITLVTGCGGSSSSTSSGVGSTSGTAGDASTSFATLETVAEGIWSGTWTNSTFGSSGSISAAISVSGDSATGAIDVGGVAFGVVDPDVQTLTSALSISGTTITFSVVSPTAGPVNVTLTPDGSGGFNFTATGSDVPGAGVSTFVVTGNMKSGSASGSSTITFFGGGTASGGFSVTKS